MSTQLHSSAPAISVTLGSGLGWGASNVRVESVHLACGSTPGMAILSLPTFRLDNSTVKTSSIIGRTVTITFPGGVVFWGKVYSIRQSFDDASENVEVVCLDSRADAAAVAIGDPDAGSSQYAVSGWDVVFNRDGKPDRASGSAVFARGDPNAVFWSVGDILSYIGTYYIEELTDIDYAAAQFSGLSGYSLYPGEVRLAGMSLVDAVDYLLSLMGDVTWALEYTHNRIVAVTTESVGTARTLTIPRSDAVTVDHWIASSGDYVRDARRAYNRVVVVGGRTIVETTYETPYTTAGSGNGLLVHDEDFLGGEVYAKRYRVDPTKYASNNLGQNLATQAAGKPWVSELVTRRALDGASYLTAAQYQAGPQSSQAVSERECLWAKEGDEEQTPEWLRATGGFEVQYDPPAILFEQTLTCLDANGAEQSIDVSDTDLHLRLTIATEIEEQPYGEYEASTIDGFSGDRTRYIERTDVVRRRRYNARLPTLPGTDPTASSVTASTLEDYWAVEGGHGYNHEDLDAIATAAGASLVRLQREFSATLEWIPSAVALGDVLYVRNEDGGSVLENASGFVPDVNDVAMIVSLDFFCGERDFRSVVHCTNQLGASQRVLGPSVTGSLLEYRRHQEFIRRLGGHGVKELVTPHDRTMAGRAEAMLERMQSAAKWSSDRYGAQSMQAQRASSMAQLAEDRVFRLRGGRR